MTTNANAVKTATTPTTIRNAEREPVKFVKRIGSTSYTISTRSSGTATETIGDKIIRLIESEVSARC